MGNLILIRHGESTANVDGKLYSHEIDSVISLTHKGIEDTVNFAKEAVLTGDFSAILCSPLHRCQQTAAILAEMDFFPMASFAIDDDLYELTTAVSDDEMQEYLENPYFIPSARTIPMIYGGMRVGHPRTLTFVDAIVEAMREDHSDDTLIISHQIRIRSIVAAKAIAGLYNEHGIGRVKELADQVICKAFKFVVKNTCPYIIVNESLDQKSIKDLTELLLSIKC